jgi:diaminopimelate epimerase
MRFSKMHGLGNDFIVIEDLDEAFDLAPDAVRWFCDRHFGIGGDGLILVRPAVSPGADFQMSYHNADGSVAEMCGNGIRCFAKYVVDHGLIDSSADSLIVETLGGPRPIRFTRDDDGSLLMATVDMGVPGLEPAHVPVDVDDDHAIDFPVETDFGTYRVTAVSMGNPHAIIWTCDVDNAPVETVGPAIETHPLFPAKTNVEFAQILDDAHIKLRVWERGVGETLACGTGACAASVAATLACSIGRTSTVELPGGELLIAWDEDGHVYMTGPATEVFTGVLEIPDNDETGGSGL